MLNIKLTKPRIIIGAILLNLVWFGRVVEAVTNKCLKVEQYQDRAWNVYHCYEPTVECCHKDNTPSCCERKSTTDLRNNLVLWGSILGVVGLIVLVYGCYKFENNCCGGDEPWQNRIKNWACCVCIRRLKHKTQERLSRHVMPQSGAKRLANNGDDDIDHVTSEQTVNLNKIDNDPGMIVFEASPMMPVPPTKKFINTETLELVNIKRNTALPPLNLQQPTPSTGELQH